MFKFIFIFLSFLSFLSFGQSSNSLLWEISGNGLEKSSYLFGTIHKNDKELFHFSDSTFIALNEVDGIMTEVDIFSAFDKYDSRYGNVYFTYDSDGKPFVTSSRSTRTKYGSEDGMPQFMDAYFQQNAENAEKDFYALETIESQEAIELSPNENIFKFNDLIHQYSNLNQMYLDGDIYVLDRYLRKSLKNKNYETVIVDRNKKMVLKLDTILKSNRSVFCAVGAGHLAGENGFIELLSKMGYTVRRVESNYSESLSVKSEVKSYSNYTLEIESLNFTAIFPGDPLKVESVDEEYDFKYIYRDYGQGNTYEIEFYPIPEKSTLLSIAEEYIAVPEESKIYKVQLENGGEAYEGISDAYPLNFYWTRVVLGDDYFVVMKAYGGNRFMASKRAQSFFEKVEMY